MSKYKNKRLHVSAFDFVFVVIFLVLLMVSAFFWAERQETKEKFNISQTKVDFIIEAPSLDQVNEIKARSDVDKIVPYVYRSVDIKGDKKTVNSNMYIIENTDELGYTVFSDSLKLEESNIAADNPLYVSSDLAKNAGLSINDTANITLSGNAVEFTITGIYKSDYRNVGGTAVAIMKNDVKKICGDKYKYNGAYVCSNDVNLTQSYIEKYVGTGDIRSADEFDNDDAYKRYLENRKNKKSTESTFYVSAFIKELERRYNSKLNRDFFISIAFIVGAALILLIDLCGKPDHYTKKDVEKDIRNNFTQEQEKQMYGQYNFWGFFLYVVAVCIFVMVSYLVLGNDVVSANNISAFVLTIVLSIIARGSTRGKLVKKFSIVSEKIKKESKGK